MGELGIINEQGDLGLGFDKLSENDIKKLNEAKTIKEDEDKNNKG